MIPLPWFQTELYSLPKDYGARWGKKWLDLNALLLCSWSNILHFSLWVDPSFELVFSDCGVVRQGTLFNCAKIRRYMKKSPSILFSLCWTKNKQTILPSFRIPILKHFFNLKPKQSGIEIDDNSLNETTIWEWLTGNVGIGFDDADRWDNCEIRDIGRLGFVLPNAWKSSCSLKIVNNYVGQVKQPKLVKDLSLPLSRTVPVFVKHLRTTKG